jgi:hypothetical protein
MKIVAERDLIYQDKKEGDKKSFKVLVTEAFIIERHHFDTGEYCMSPGNFACKIIYTESLKKNDILYGVDSVQAFQQAFSQIDHSLKHLSKKYEIFWYNGEPYFDS